MIRLRLCLAAALVAAPPAGFGPAMAQSNSPGWFVPPAASPAPAQARAASPHTRVTRAAPVASAPPPEPDPSQADAQGADPQAGGDPQAQIPAADLPQPPAPALPPVAKGAAPPVASMGVLGVPDVMHQSSAAQIVEKIVGARKEKLQRDVDRAEASWRQAMQQLQADAAKLTPDQGRARERALRERVNAERHQLQDRNRIIQEAGQVALGQIERTLIGVIRQVAESRGMNLVLHRSQVALNIQEFDITEAVVQQLNRVLPTVQIPPEDVDPATLPKSWGSPVMPLAAGK